MRLFGFAKEEERMLFLDLLKVDGIGPKQAIRILSGANVDSFAEILEAGDVTRSNDTGKRREIGPEDHSRAQGKTHAQGGGRGRGRTDLVTALADMGFDRRKAAAVVASLLEETREKACGRKARTGDLPQGDRAVEQLGPWRRKVAPPGRVSRKGDAKEAGLRPKRLGDFQGQDEIKQNLGVFIQAARERRSAWITSS
jgi:hypothetical protein